MSTFKKGDKVRVVKRYPGWLEVGEEYRVLGGSDHYMVLIDHPDKGEGGFEPEYFELVTERELDALTEQAQTQRDLAREAAGEASRAANAASRKWSDLVHLADLAQQYGFKVVPA